MVKRFLAATALAASVSLSAHQAMAARPALAVSMTAAEFTRACFVDVPGEEVLAGCRGYVIGALAALQQVKASGYISDDIRISCSRMSFKNDRQLADYVLSLWAQRMRGEGPHPDSVMSDALATGVIWNIVTISC